MVTTSGHRAAESTGATASAVRRAVGIVRIVAALVTLAAIGTQIVDQSLNDAFSPTEYFSYFTIQTSLLEVVVLVVGGVLALRHRFDSEVFTAVRVAAVTYSTVTATVYAVLLRGIPADGFVGVAWPNEVIHVAIPILLALDWVLAPGRVRIGWRTLWLVVSYPLIWVGITLVRGLVTGWFPYPFLEPGGPGGWASVAGYVLGISVFVVAIASIAIVISRVGGRRAVVVRQPSDEADTVL